ncbi:DUF2530 domain-containing protein [Bifidobacterium callimiconis]|uniref:DUF2530 domain-containing protein n=1 Tax=Bifidobacterium callimiconis TaxID=2306973 RepID=A0A430FE09_9BIFI|nr:DUF2530 domain-containing protein [Bifidobacterium callimiconis]MBT1177355.1 DUF2530 domain-containing protein [Bifidobacterium callimiconis]RSX51093.1 hypothetical protein D2E23_0938 [Bifidobacterium callimiconis]
MKLAPILDPGARKPGPKPAQVDLHRVFFIGTTLWLIAGIICLILVLLGKHATGALIVCVAGMIIGVLLLIWEHFNRWYYRRLGNQK